MGKFTTIDENTEWVEADAKPEPIEKPSIDLDKNSVLIVLNVTKPGLVKAVNDKSVIQSDANADRLRVSAEIMKSPAYESIKKLDGQVRNWLRRVALPSAMLSRSAYRIPTAMLPSVVNQLKGYAAQREVLVASFVDEYDEAETDGRIELGADFDQATEKLTPGTIDGQITYYEKSAVASYFDMQWRTIAFAEPTAIANVDPELFAEEVKKGEALMVKELDIIRDALRVSFKELISNMVTQLEFTEGEKKPRFAQSHIDRMSEFLELFDMKNLAQDDVLAGLVENARNIMNGMPTDAQAIVDDDTMRAEIAASFATVAEGLKSVDAVEFEPIRKVKIT